MTCEILLPYFSGFVLISSMLCMTTSVTELEKQWFILKTGYTINVPCSAVSSSKTFNIVGLMRNISGKCGSHSRWSIRHSWRASITFRSIKTLYRWSHLLCWGAFSEFLHLIKDAAGINRDISFWKFLSFIKPSLYQARLLPRCDAQLVPWHLIILFFRKSNHLLMERSRNSNLY